MSGELVVALKDEVDASARKLASLATNMLSERLNVRPGEPISVALDVTGIFLDGHHPAVGEFLKACIAHSHLRARYSAALASLPTVPR